MAKLCPQMSSVLTSTAIENLNQRKIFTVIDVLQENAGKLAAISKLDFKDVVTMRQSLIVNYSPFPRQGLDVYNELMSNCACLPSGIEGLDCLLGGGFLTGNVIELCGLSGAGKTQLCLTVSINVAQQLMKNVHFIDTKMDFCAKRIHSMLEARHIDEDDVGAIMEKIKVTRTQHFSELYSYLCCVKETLHREPGSVRLLIIDSLPAIFLQFMGSLKMDSLGLMNHLVSLIKYIAHEQHVSFLVVNLASKWLEEESAPLPDADSEDEPNTPLLEIKPALGKYWAHIPNTRLFIDKGDSAERRVISVMKSSHLPVGEVCSVQIEDQGVV